MRRRQTIGVVVAVAAGCLAVVGGSRAAAVDVEERPGAAAADAPAKHYVEIPLGPRAPAPPAAPASEDAAPAPIKPPTTPEIDAALRELGDADFRKREAATERLQEIGAAALPALRYTRETAADPEVASRAEAAIRNLERPKPRGLRVPGATYRGIVRPQFGGDFGPLNNNLNLQLRQEHGGRRKLEVREAGGRVVRIDEGPDGIRMSVTTRENGKDVTRDYQAATAEQLKAKDPAAFELYNRWSGRAGGAIRVMPQPFQPRVEPLPADVEERMRELRRLQRQQMREMQRRRAAERAAADARGARDAAAAEELLGLLDELRPPTRG